MGKKHDLLIDDGQLLILEVSLAVLIGDRQAIALQQIHFWVEINRKAAKETHFFDGRWWVYNTWNEWRNGNESHDPNFPFWSIATIRRVFDDLQKMKLIITRQHEDRNKGLWVTIDYDALHGLSKSTDGSAQNEQTGLRKMSRRSRQSAQTTSTTETTETTTETTQKSTLPNGDMPPDLVAQNVPEYLIPVFHAVKEHIFDLHETTQLEKKDIEYIRAIAQIARTKAGKDKTAIDIATHVRCYAETCGEDGYHAPKDRNKFSLGFAKYMQSKSRAPKGLIVVEPPARQDETEFVTIPDGYFEGILK